MSRESGLPPLVAGRPHLWCMSLHGHDRPEGRAALRRVVSAYAGIAPRDLSLTSGEYGKPLFPGLPWQASVAHTTGMLVVAVAVEQAVGVDVEPWDAAGRAASVIDAELDDDERSALDTLTGSARERAALVAWVRLEAVAKATGDGLMTSAAARRAARRRLACRTIDIRSHHVAAVAVTGPLDDVVVGHCTAIPWT